MSPDISAVCNEETLRAQVLVPFLNELGLSPNEIVIERSFRVRLGHRLHEPNNDFASGRSDLLVKNAYGDNLFVIELKAPTCKLTDEDRDQGISYARLLDQIAPFVLLTNGEDSRLFDSVTKEEIDAETISSPSSFYGSGRKLATTEDIRIRWEALSHFVGYSPENVKIFSNLQIEAHLEPLKGDVGDERKFVRSLYVNRGALRKAIGSFLAGPGVAFVVAGDSGVGKTNELCALAEDISSTHIVLFLAAYNLTGGPGEALRKEFNWNFSHQINQQDLFAHLIRIRRSIQNPIVVIIDGLDEAPIPNFPSLMSEFTGILRSAAGAIKLIASVKSTDWPAFEKIRNNPSGLALALDSSWMEGIEDYCSSGVSKPFILDEFSENEYKQASEKYKQKYNLPGLPQGQLKQYCRVPLWLRVVSEAYSGSNSALPKDITESHIANKWLERKYAFMTDPSKARQDLYVLAKAIFDNTTDRVGKLVAVDLSSQSVDEMGLSIQPSEELVVQGIIHRSQDDHGRRYLRFKHSRILSYILAKQVLRLDQIGIDEFETLLPRLLRSHLLQDALAWHLREGNSDHISLLEKEISGWALIFINRYSEIRDSMLGQFRSSLEPYTSGSIGLAYSVNETGLGWYGLRSIDQASDKRVVELGFDRSGLSDSVSARLHALGCSRIYGGGRNFANSDPNLAAAEFSLEGVKNAIADRGLDDGVSDELRVEAICAICSAYRKELGLTDKMPLYLAFESILPLDLLKLKSTIQEWFGKELFLKEKREECIRGLRDSGRNESEANYLFSGSYDVAQEAKEWAQQALEAGRVFVPPSSRNMQDIAKLSSLIEFYLNEGRKVLTFPVLPVPDRRPASGAAAMPEFYSDEGIAALIKCFFHSGFSSYKLLLERNFPTMASKFPKYPTSPFKIFSVYFRPDTVDKYNLWGRLEWGIVRLQPDEDPTPSVNIASAKDPKLNEQRHRVAPNGQKWDMWSSCDLSSILSPYSTRVTNSRQKAEVARNEPIRAFVYSLLEDDFRSISADDFLGSDFGE